MSMVATKLPCGQKMLELNVPKENLLGVLEGEPVSPEVLEKAFVQAWDHPIGISDPSDIIQPGEKVAFVVTDHTRPTPTRLIFPLIWERIRARVEPQDVTILVATGTHRSPTEEELDAMLGNMRRGFRVLSHCCDKDVVEIGRSSRGTPVLVNRIVAESDHVVTIGHIGMHYFAGYSGGRKNIFPGVAGRATIEANHSQLLDSGCEGCVYEGNPISEEMCEAARLVGVDFIVDVVLDSEGRVAKVVVGDMEEAHAVGRAFWDALFHVNVEERADVVIASAGGHPKDINLYQAYKALYNAGKAVKDDGLILLVAACPDGAGHAVFEDWMLRCQNANDVFGILEREGFKLGGHKGVYLAKDLQRAQIYLLSDMEDGLARQFFLEPVSELAQFLEVVRSKFGQAYRVIVMPHGGDVFPSEE